jgi:Domain of unknown function (DUF4359)
MSNQPTQLQPNHWGKGGIALLTMGVVMIFTNPNREAYNHYASETLVGQLQKDCQGELCSVINPLLSMGKPVLRGIIDSTTKQQNLVICSLYTTELPGKTVKTLGLFGNFITFQS